MGIFHMVSYKLRTDCAYRITAGLKQMADRGLNHAQIYQEIYQKYVNDF